MVNRLDWTKIFAPYQFSIFQDYELDETVGFAASDAEVNEDKHENDVLQFNPMIILPLKLPRMAKKVLVHLKLAIASLLAITVMLNMTKLHSIKSRKNMNYFTAIFKMSTRCGLKFLINYSN
jgi:hypothetical protein